MSHAPTLLTSALDRAGSPTAQPAVPALARLAKLRQALLEAPYGLCTRKAELLTEYFREHAPADPVAGWLAERHFALVRRALKKNLSEGTPQRRWQLRAGNLLLAFYRWREARSLGEPLVLHHARGLEQILARMELRIYDHELIVGNPSSCRVGAPIHPDLGGLLMLPELDELARRPVNPMQTTAAQTCLLEQEIFPFWFPRCVQSRAGLLAADPELPNVLVRGRRFILTQFAGISHVTPDYPAVLESGFEGLLARTLARLGEVREPEGRAFLEAVATCARAAIAFGARWSAHCREQASHEPDPGRAAELRQLGDILERVPARPARSFHEAVQSLFLTHVIVHQESFQHGVSFGRLDRILAPYYKRDIERGELDREGAVEILGCFLGKAAELLPLFNQMATEYFSGLSSASGITLSGATLSRATTAGEEAVTEVALLILEAYDQMRLRQPNIHLRVHPESDPRLIDRAYEVLKKGGGMPAFFNDRAIVPALEKQGIEPADAQDYSIVGCVEWGVPARSFPAAGACFLSLAAVLDRALHGGEEPGPQRTASRFGSMQAIFEAFCTELEQTIAAAVAGNDAIESAHALYRPTPLLSLLVDGCVETAREVNAGGARYNSTGMQGVGLADVADSLAAIEAVVFESQRLSLADLMEAVDSDFAGQPELLAWIECRVPKWGQDRGRPEHWARLVSEFYAQTVATHRNPRGGPYVAGFWTMTTHIGFGSRLGALPSGRRSGAPLGDGISPANGCDNEGPTASLIAAASVGSEHVGNGLCLNEKLDPWYVRGEQGTRLLDGLTRGYFDEGGMQVQYNILDIAELLDAKAHPERHRDLVVRISGYSAYFNDLTEAMKDDIIARTQHGATPGPACQGEGTA